MKITLDLTESQVNALARTMQFDCPSRDDLVRDEILTVIVGRAALLHNLRSPEVCAVFARAYHETAPARRLPKSKRTGPGGRAT